MGLADKSINNEEEHKKVRNERKSDARVLISIINS